MLDAILAQFGISAEQIEAFKRQALSAGQKIESFDARLAALERLARAIADKVGVPHE